LVAGINRLTAISAGSGPRAGPGLSARAYIRVMVYVNRRKNLPENRDEAVKLIIQQAPLLANETSV
jgi:hypothetical protein